MTCVCVCVQGVVLQPPDAKPGEPPVSPWRMFDNKSFTTCPTYPPFFVVPRMSSNIVRAHATCRSLVVVLTVPGMCLARSRHSVAWQRFGLKAGCQR